MIIGICGAGTMGRGIALSCLFAGHSTILFDLQNEALEASRLFVEEQSKKAVEKGKLAVESLHDVLSRSTMSSSLADLSLCDFVIEAIVEKPEPKHDLFSKLEEIVSETCILATNTSSISITSLARTLRLPQRFIGLHFFNPAHIMKLVEIVVGVKSADEVVSRSIEFITGLGKTPVRAKDVPGFIVNRVARNYYNEAQRIVMEQGASLEQVDRIMKSAGFKMGPFELMDLIGVDTNLDVTKSIWELYFHEPRFAPSNLQQSIVSAGLLGKKSGQGFYDYAKRDSD